MFLDILNELCGHEVFYFSNVYKYCSFLKVYKF